MGIPEGEERQKGAESLIKEIIAENFPNPGKELVIQYMKLRELLITSIQKNLLQDTLC